VRKNLTLTLDADLLKAARKLAVDRDTSVNQLVRDYLVQLVQRKDPQLAAAAALREFFSTHSVTIGERTWTRDELHERG